MQKYVTTSVTEAEIVAATDCVQGILFGMRLLESIGPKVQKPMVLEMDNKGGTNLLNSWSIGDQTRALAVRLAYLRELREDGILEYEWIPSGENMADLYTKNLDGPTFGLHAGVAQGG